MPRLARSYTHTMIPSNCARCNDCVWAMDDWVASYAQFSIKVMRRLRLTSAKDSWSFFKERFQEPRSPWWFSNVTELSASKVHFPVSCQVELCFRASLKISYYVETATSTRLSFEIVSVTKA